jgi:hypothetical protein
LLSAFYYSPEAHSQASGVITLRVVGEGNRLSGSFTQYELNRKEEFRMDERLRESGPTFELTRITVSWFRQLRMMCWLKPFQTYEEARKALPNAYSGQAIAERAS